jgi:hypothetical protein
MLYFCFRIRLACDKMAEGTNGSAETSGLYGLSTKWHVRVVYKKRRKNSNFKTRNKLKIFFTKK